MNLRYVVLGFIALLIAGQSATSAQQLQGLARPTEDFSAFVGGWQADPRFREAEGPKPRFVNTLVWQSHDVSGTRDRRHRTDHEAEAVCSRNQAQPDGTLVQMQNTRVTIAYRRIQ